MSRKSWSNVFLLLASANLAFCVLPNRPFKPVTWIAAPCFLTLGALARRRMI